VESGWCHQKIAFNSLRFMGSTQPIIKTGFCVAYDWRLLENSLPPVYQRSDLICLAIDKHRRSWSGNPFEFDEKEFYRWVKANDPDNKIVIYEDDFSRPELTARENCNRHRMMIAQRMGEGGWHVQIDCDEYFVDFNGFAQFLRALNPNPTGHEKPFNVHVFLYDLFKRVDDGYLFAYPKASRPFSAPFATTKPEYIRARHNGHFNRISPFYVVHETWARNADELRFKLSNWGHAAEEFKKADVRESYIKLWSAIDSHNYKYLVDFHFAVPHGWERLGFVKASSVKEFMEKFDPGFAVNSFYLKLVNSRVYGGLKFRFDRIMRKVGLA